MKLTRVSEKRTKSGGTRHASRFIRKWRSETRVSSAILRQFQDESARYRDKSTLPQSPERLSLVDRSLFTEGKRPKYHRTSATGRRSKNTMGKNAVKRPRLRRIHFNHLHLLPSPGDSPSGHRGEERLPPSPRSPSLSSPLRPVHALLRRFPFSFLISQPLSVRPVITALLHRNVFDEFVNEPRERGSFLRPSRPLPASAVPDVSSRRGG